jgi:Domain of unknown function (DUF4331)
MSHHLDSPLAWQDVRLDITDLYVLRGESGTVFILDVNCSIAGQDAPQGFHPEARYQLHIDLDGDAEAELTYRFTFAPREAGGRQAFEIRQLSGPAASDPAEDGFVIAAGATGTPSDGSGGIRAWVGTVPDPFYIDPTVLKAVGTAFALGAAVDLTGWTPGGATNLFAGTTVNAIVLEVPDSASLLRTGQRVGVWATTMLATDDGGWRPINRAGQPMIQPIFNPDDSQEASDYNTSQPADDWSNYHDRFERKVEAVVAAMGTSDNPRAYSEAVIRQILPDVLTYVIGTPATFGFADRNGRPLGDNAPAVMFSMVTNSALGDGLTLTSATGDQTGFPYLATTEEVGI